MASFGHVSGDAMLDLVNTVDWRLSDEKRSEKLASYADVLAWCVESGVVTGAESARLAEAAAADPATAAAELAQVIDARDALYRALFEGDDMAAAALTRRYRDALAVAELHRDGDRWTWRDPDLTLPTPRHRIVRGLIGVTQRDDLDRLHQCEDAECGWIYLDTSPRRNRRWCAAADCGDRNRARAYYARKTRSGG